MAWPAIATPSAPIEEEVYLPQVRTEFDGNYVQSRPRTTRARYRWTLTWNLMSEADYETLAAYFIANQGGSDTWTNPMDSQSYTIRFVENSLRSSAISASYRKVAVKIEEV